jgi:hypothetical protein
VRAEPKRERRRCLIKGPFSVEEAAAHWRREKNLRDGHISALNTWWARRRSPRTSEG